MPLPYSAKVLQLASSKSLVRVLVSVDVVLGGNPVKVEWLCPVVAEVEDVTFSFGGQSPKQ